MSKYSISSAASEIFIPVIRRVNNLTALVVPSQTQKNSPIKPTSFPFEGTRFAPASEGPIEIESMYAQDPYKEGWYSIIEDQLKAIGKEENFTVRGPESGIQLMYPEDAAFLMQDPQTHAQELLISSVTPEDFARYNQKTLNQFLSTDKAAAKAVPILGKVFSASYHVDLQEFALEKGWKIRFTEPVRNFVCEAYHPPKGVLCPVPSAKPH